MGYEDASSASSATAVSDNEDARPLTSPNVDSHAIQLDDVGAGSSLNRTRSGQAPRRRKMSLSDARKKRKAEDGERKGRREIPIAVVEQRVSNLAQGAFCMTMPPSVLSSSSPPGLVLMTKPFEHVLGLIPKGVLAGLFVSPIAHSWRH